jgi:general secretion pathway protein H
MVFMRKKIIAAGYQQAGFSLIEMLVVITILALAGSIAMAKLHNPPNRIKIEAAGRNVAAIMRLAHARAVAGNRQAVVMVDVASRFISFEKSTRFELPDAISLKLTVARPERLGESVAGIRFFPDGTSTGGDIDISSGQDVAHIAVNWLTGAVTLKMSTVAAQ